MKISICLWDFFSDTYLCRENIQKLNQTSFHGIISALETHEKLFLNLDHKLHKLITYINTVYDCTLIMIVCDEQHCPSTNVIVATQKK